MNTGSQFQKKLRSQSAEMQKLKGGKRTELQFLFLILLYFLNKQDGTEKGRG